MEVIILSKTHLGSNGACVGGMVVRDGSFVRLMRGKNNYQPANTPFEIGQRWELSFEKSPDAPPHIEDVIVHKQNYIGDCNNLKGLIEEKCIISTGGPEDLFEGKLKWTSRGKGFLDNKQDVPSNSVGFWIPDRDLLAVGEHFMYKYRRFFKQNKQVKYKGFPKMISKIPKGTLCKGHKTKCTPIK